MQKTGPRIAVVGCRHWGKNLARNFSDLKGLAALCETNESQWPALREQYPDSCILGSFAEVLAADSTKAVAMAGIGLPFESPHSRQIYNQFVICCDAVANWQHI